MKLALLKRAKQTVPMRTPDFASLSSELQECVFISACDNNMSPQEYLESLNNPNRRRQTMSEYIKSLDTTEMGTCSLEEFLEIMDESRICN